MVVGIYCYCYIKENPVSKNVSQIIVFFKDLILDEDGSPMLTKEELYTTWKTSDEQPRVDDEELFKILRKTRKQLRSSKKFSRAKRRK